jgi:hypothetical protein
MIVSLADAWTWYESVKELTLAMQTLAVKHWNQLTWEGELGQDNRLRDLTEPRIVDRAENVLGNVNDLCVLLFFSVFEAVVRDRVLGDMRRNRSPLQHPAVGLALRNWANEKYQKPRPRTLGELPRLPKHPPIF